MRAHTISVTGVEEPKFNINPTLIQKRADNSTNIKQEDIENSYGLSSLVSPGSKPGSRGRRSRLGIDASALQ